MKKKKGEGMGGHRCGGAYGGGGRIGRGAVIQSVHHFSLVSSG